MTAETRMTCTPKVTPALEPSATGGVEIGRMRGAGRVAAIRCADTVHPDALELGLIVHAGAQAPASAPR